MLNYIWGIMIVVGVVYGVFTGNMDAVTNGALDSAKEGISLCIAMLGVMGLWSGLMEIAKKAGLIEIMGKGIAPFLDFMFPTISKNAKIKEYITINVISNILGLGSAATPAGLQAMELLGEEMEKKKMDRRVASNEMCTLLVLNISSLQLIPVNMIAYRSQYGSVSPTAVIGPGMIATLVSTVVGIIFCKIATRYSEKKV